MLHYFFREFRQFYDVYIGLRTYMKENYVSHAYVICTSLPVIFVH